MAPQSPSASARKEINLEEELQQLATRDKELADSLRALAGGAEDGERQKLAKAAHSLNTAVKGNKSSEDVGEAADDLAKAAVRIASAHNNGAALKSISPQVETAITAIAAGKLQKQEAQTMLNGFEERRRDGYSSSYETQPDKGGTQRDKTYTLNEWNKGDKAVDAAEDSLKAATTGISRRISSRATAVAAPAAGTEVDPTTLPAGNLTRIAASGSAIEAALKELKASIVAQADDKSNGRVSKATADEQRVQKASEAYLKARTEQQDAMGLQRKPEEDKNLLNFFKGVSQKEADALVKGQQDPLENMRKAIAAKVIGATDPAREAEVQKASDAYLAARAATRTAQGLPAETAEQTKGFLKLETDRITAREQLKAAVLAQSENKGPATVQEHEEAVKKASKAYLTTRAAAFKAMGIEETPEQAAKMLESVKKEAISGRFADAKAGPEPKFMTEIGVIGTPPIDALTLQKALKQKFPEADLGKTGRNNDGIDGQAGRKTVDAFYKLVLKQEPPKRIDDIVLTKEQRDEIVALAREYDKTHGRAAAPARAPHAAAPGTGSDVNKLVARSGEHGQGRVDPATQQLVARGREVDPRTLAEARKASAEMDMIPIKANELGLATNRAFATALIESVTTKPAPGSPAGMERIKQLQKAHGVENPDGIMGAREYGFAMDDARKKFAQKYPGANDVPIHQQVAMLNGSREAVSPLPNGIRGTDGMPAGGETVALAPIPVVESAIVKRLGEKGIRELAAVVTGNGSLRDSATSINDTTKALETALGGIAKVDGKLTDQELNAAMARFAKDKGISVMKVETALSDAAKSSAHEITPPTKVALLDVPVPGAGQTTQRR